MSRKPKSHSKLDEWQCYTHDRRANKLIVGCSSCSETASKTFTSPEIGPTHAARSFRHKGWSFDERGEAWCPTCTNKGSVDALDDEQKSLAAAAALRKLNRLLRIHADVDDADVVHLSEGWDVARLSAESGLSIEVVTREITTRYGELVAPEVQQIRAEMSAAYDRYRTSVGKLSNELSREVGDLRDLLESKYEAVRKSVTAARQEFDQTLQSLSGRIAKLEARA